MNLPNIVYIGYQKTGSAFLRRYFDFHPDIHWTRYAGLLQRTPLDPAEYHRQFAAEPPAKCFIDMNEGLALGHLFRDADAWHERCAMQPGCPIDGRAMEPSGAAVAANIKRALPHARVLITIRNQLDWIRSNYLHYILHLPHSQRSLEGFLSTGEGKLVLQTAHFDEVIGSYRDVFGAERVHVLPLELLERDEPAALAGLCAFLGVRFLPFARTERRHNEGIGPARGNLVRFFSSVGVSDAAMRRMRRLARPVEGPLGRILGRDVMSRRQIALLRSAYAVSNYRTSRLLGVDLASLGYPV
jgi:hypothetical protein